MSEGKIMSEQRFQFQSVSQTNYHKKLKKMKIEKDENSAQVIRTKFGPLRFLKLNNRKLDLDKSSFCVTMSYYT